MTGRRTRVPCLSLPGPESGPPALCRPCVASLFFDCAPQFFLDFSVDSLRISLLLLLVYSLLGSIPGTYAPSLKRKAQLQSESLNGRSLEALLRRFCLFSPIPPPQITHISILRPHLHHHSPANTLDDAAQGQRDEISVRATYDRAVRLAARALCRSMPTFSFDALHTYVNRSLFAPHCNPRLTRDRSIFGASPTTDGQSVPQLSVSRLIPYATLQTLGEFPSTCSGDYCALDGAYVVGGRTLFTSTKSLYFVRLHPLFP